MNETIISSSGFRDFALAFSSQISNDDYPIHIFRALNQLDRGNVASAILNLDVSMSSVAEVFTKLGDRARASLYSFLIVKLRKKALAEVNFDRSFLTGLDQLYEPELSKTISNGTEDVAKTLSCLVTLDSLRMPFEHLAKSRSFTTCLKGDVEN